MICSNATSNRSDISVLTRFLPYSDRDETNFKDVCAGEWGPGRLRFAISVPVLEDIIRLSDMALLFACIVLINCFHYAPDLTTRNQEILTAVVGSGVTALSLRLRRNYSLTVLRSGLMQITIAVMSLIAGILTIFLILRFMGVLGHDEIMWALEWLVAAAVLLTLSRIVFFALMRRWDRLGSLVQNFVVVGATAIGSSFITQAARPGSGLRFVGLYEDGATKGSDVSDDIRRSVAELITRSRRERIDMIVIAVPLTHSDKITELTEQLSVTVSDLYLVTDLPTVCPNSNCATGIGHGPAILISRRPLKDWEAFQKRAFDLAVATLAFVFVFPMLALIALLIKLDSPGPILFRQPRLGFNNLLFDVYKFRTMHHNMADLHADQQTQKNDKRVTRIGRWLRKLSLDELPQLFNVLTGEMSLVGPRPHALNTKAGEHRFTDVVTGYALRHRVKPGITGWAQVNGWRGETRTIDQIESRVAHDLHYIENWSLFLDMKIMFLTILREIASPQAY